MTAGSTDNSYSDLLKRPEWQEKRQKILERDNYTCQSCGKRSSDGKWLQVHHTYYRHSWMPWDYPAESLITWCEFCHNSRHELRRAIHKAIDKLRIQQFYELWDMVQKWLGVK